MAVDNRDSFVEIADPFDSTKKIGAVRALTADIAIVHALAADQYGNTIMSPVSQDTLWGAKASTGGVLVTCEKIVHDRVHPAVLTPVRYTGLPGQIGFIVPAGSTPGRAFFQRVGDRQLR